MLGVSQGEFKRWILTKNVLGMAHKDAGDIEQKMNTIFLCMDKKKDETPGDY